MSAGVSRLWRREEAEDLDVWQLWLGVLLIVVAVATIRPLGLHGEGLLLLVLLVANAALLLQRSLPESVVPARWRLALIVAGAFASAALLGLDSQSIATVFPYFVTGHAGFRLPARLAFGIAALTTVCCVVALLLAHASGRPSQDWYFGLLVGLPVFIGQSNRSHAQAMHTARELADQTRRTAAAEADAQALAERGRIARDVHDVLAHSLAAVNMQLEVADVMLEGGRVEEARTATRRAQSLVRDGLTEVRRTVSALREDALPLEESLHQLVTSTGGDDAVDVDGEPRALPTELTQTLVRCVQEGVTNARRHAAGAAVRVTVRYLPGSVSVEVLNGPGAPSHGGSPGDSGSGLGLVGMRERVALAGGRATIGAVTEGPCAGGWRILVELPT